MWLVDGVLQKGLFYWLLADVLADFTYDWATSILEAATEAGCNLEHLLLDGTASGFTAIQGWQGVIVFGAPITSNGIVWNQGAAQSQNGRMEYNLSVNLHNERSFTGPVQGRLRVIATGEIVDFQEITATAPFGTHGMVLSGTIDRSRVVVPEFRCFQGNFSIPVAIPMILGDADYP